MDFSTIIFIIVIFLLVTLFVLLKFFFETRNDAFLFAAVGSFVLTVVFLWVTVGVSMEELLKGSCEFLVSNSTYDGNTVFYNYFYTCAERRGMEILEIVYTILTVVIYALFIGVCLIPVIYLVSLIKKKF